MIQRNPDAEPVLQDTELIALAAVLQADVAGMTAENQFYKDCGRGTAFTDEQFMELKTYTMSANFTDNCVSIGKCMVVDCLPHVT